MELRFHWPNQPIEVAKMPKNRRFAWAAGVDIAGVASSILATPTIFPAQINRLVARVTREMQQSAGAIEPLALGDSLKKHHRRSELMGVGDRHEKLRPMSRRRHAL